MLNDKQMQEIYLLREQGKSMYSLAKLYGVSPQGIAKRLATYKPQIRYVVQIRGGKICKIHMAESQSTVYVDVFGEEANFEVFFPKDGEKENLFLEKIKKVIKENSNETDFYIYF